MSGPGPYRPHVEIWQQSDSAWRWRYVAGVGEERVELPSNEPDSSREEAMHGASVAYPGVPVEILEPSRSDPKEGHGSGGARRSVPRLAVSALIAAGWVTAAIRHPRWWTTGPVLAAVAATVRRLRSR